MSDRPPVHVPVHHHGPPRFRFCSACAAPLERRTVEGKLLPVCPRCGQVVYADPKVAAGTIIEDAGRILLLRRAISPARGLWTFPGGYVDRGEPVPEAAAREAFEEAGVTVTVDGLHGVYSARGVAVVLIVYRARIAAGTPHAGAEALEVRWFDPEGIPWQELAFPSTAEALADWRSSAAQ